jgi:hypothetical protein
VTEEQWQGSESPDAMLDAIAGSARATDSRLRLFACSCVWRVWDLLQDENEEPIRTGQSTTSGHRPGDSVPGCCGPDAKRRS